MKITALQNVMVSIGLKTVNSGDLLKIGLPRVFRTKADQQRLTDLYAAKATDKTPTLDVFRLGRTDGAGNQQADGGYQIFTTEGQKMVTPSVLAADLAKYGYHLTVAEVFQAEGNEEHIKLRLTWSRSSSTKVTLDDRQKKAVRKYFDLVYWKLFGFYNLEAVSLEGEVNPIQGSIVTLNFSGVVNDRQVDHSAIREVKMVDQDGHISCPLRVTTPAAPAVPHRCPERTPVKSAGSLGEAMDNGIRAK